MKDEIRFQIEVRADEARQGPGRLVGLLMKYGAQATDRRELFENGALEWPEGGVVLNRQHTRKSPILRFTPEINGDEVRIDVQLPDTTSGRDAAVEVRSGLLRGLSVEFPLPERARFRGCQAHPESHADRCGFGGLAQLPIGG